MFKGDNDEDDLDDALDDEYVKGNEDLYDDDDDDEPIVRGIPYTGFFRDGVRRIDMVLVTKDNGDYESDQVKVRYLTSLVKMGLELEIEPGVMDRHQDLIFIKIHAPNKVIEKYIHFYDLYDHFKKKHQEIIRPWAMYKLWFFRFLIFENEKDWLRFFRLEAGKFSNIERSRVVIKLLSACTYGNDTHEYGINMLIKNNIFIDSFALHDGPYCLLEKQRRGYINPRQMLYYEWASADKVFKMQPIHLVAEYFGDKVAFLYAFEEHFTFFLMFFSIAGFVSSVMGYNDGSNTNLIERICNDNDTYMCPACRSFQLCPFVKINQYCSTARVISLIDHSYTLYFGLFASVWALVFTAYWKRSEAYYSWIWGLSTEHIKEDLVHYTEYGEVHHRHRARVLAYRTLFTVVIGFFAVVLILIVNLMIIYFKLLIFKKLEHRPTFFSMYLASAAINLVLLVIFDEAILGWCLHYTYKISLVLNRFEAHYQEETYERSLIAKIYIFVFFFTFVPIIYSAIIKWYGGHWELSEKYGKVIFVNGYSTMISYAKISLSSFYTYPADPKTWYSVLGLAMMNCGPNGCMDETWIQILILLIGKQLMFWMYRFIYIPRTDYNQGEVITNRAPSWEREYRLPEYTESMLIASYRDAVTQFAMVTLFVTAFPIAPLLAMIDNLISHRINSNLLLTAYRRPVFDKGPGLGAWLDVLTTISYLTSITNAMVIAWTTNTIPRRVYREMFPYIDEDFFNFTMSYFDINDYLAVKGPHSPHDTFIEYEGFKPERYCLYNGMRRPPWVPRKYERRSSYWVCGYYQLLFIVLFEHFTLFVVLLFYYLLPDLPRKIRYYRAMEARIKHIFYTTRYARQK